MRKIFLLVSLEFAVLAGRSQAWKSLGNSSTNPSIHFIGTTDNKAVPELSQQNNDLRKQLDELQKRLEKLEAPVTKN